MSEDSVALIAEEIERYCDAHPNARDTIDGIAWWLQMQRYEEKKVSIVNAVQLLVERGALERHRLQDGSEVFGRKRSTGVE